MGGGKRVSRSRRSGAGGKDIRANPLEDETGSNEQRTRPWGERLEKFLEVLRK